MPDPDHAPDPHALEAEIEAIDETVHAVLKQNAELWKARNAIVADLIQTFPHATLDDLDDPNPRSVPFVVTSYSRNGAPQRADIFHQLDRINKLLAPVRNRLRELRADRAIAERQLKAANKPKPKQPDLFA